jgi:FkbM family methyltransferase
MGITTGASATQGWAAYDLIFVEPYPSCTTGRQTGDGGVLLAGKIASWGYIARAPLPDPLRRPGVFRVRAQLLIKQGSVGLGVLTADETDFHQQAVAYGAGRHTIEIVVECTEAPGPVILRNGSPDEGDTEFELVALEFQALDIEIPEQLLRLPDQHPAVAKFPRWSGIIAESVVANWLGTTTKLEYTGLAAGSGGERRVVPRLPAFGAEYFRWSDLLEAVAGAGDKFTMVELGAGWGRWLVDAASALRQIGKAGLPIMLIGVEAEPQHFAWMRDHFVANGLDPAKHQLIEAAVAAKDGSTLFTCGHAGAWYGQGMVADPKWRADDWPDARARKVRTVSLATVLDGISFADLIVMDVQGAEAEVAGASRALLNDRVKRVHIGTHGDAIEIALRQAFTAMGWKCVADYPNQRESNTPYGTIRFHDGVQSWLNPRFG